MGEVSHGSLLQILLEHCDFLNIDISQGSVATRLRCGGIFKYELVANLPVSLPVKEFGKSVNIWGSYGQKFGVLFFLRHSVVCMYVTHCDSCALHRTGPLCMSVTEVIQWSIEDKTYPYSSPPMLVFHTTANTLIRKQTHSVKNNHLMCEYM